MHQTFLGQTWTLTRRLIAFSALVLVVLYGSASASLQTPNKGDPTLQRNDTEASSNPSSGVSISMNVQQQPPAPSQQTSSSQASQQDNGQQPSGWFERWLDAWLQPLTIVGILVFIVYTLIFIAMLRQLGEMGKTANATNQIVRLSQTSQRAWVGPIGTVSIVGTVPIQAGPPIAFEVTILNSGNTPALEVETRIMARSQPTGEDFAPEYPPLPGALPHYGSKAVTQPRTQFTLTTQPTGPVTPQIIAALASGQIVFYVYGKIDYKDVFGELRHTTFCAFLHPSLDRMSFCKTYNTAD